MEKKNSKSKVAGIVLMIGVIIVVITIIICAVNKDRILDAWKDQTQQGTEAGTDADDTNVDGTDTDDTGTDDTDVDDTEKDDKNPNDSDTESSTEDINKDTEDDSKDKPGKLPGKDDDFYQDYDKDADHDNFEDCNEVLVNGISITLPCSYKDLVAAGFYMNETDLNSTIEPEDYEYFELHSKDNNYIADVQIINQSKNACLAKDGQIIYLAFYYEGEETIYKNMEFTNGFTVFTTVKEAMDILGEPNKKYVDDKSAFGKYECYCWEFDKVDGNYTFVSLNFYNDEVFLIEVNNGPMGY